jgi:predicted DsbA family dithiol-disulfide isomerase
MPNELSIEVWSDVVCPWCYIGKRRLEAALARFPQRERTRVVYRSYELDPSAPAQRDVSQTHAERIAQKYGTTTTQAQAMIARVVSTAAEEGLVFDFDKSRSGNTFTLHRLLHLARARGRQQAVNERFFRAYFCEGEAVGLPEVAGRIAIDAGLEADEVAGLLAGDLYADAVRSDQREARELGISGVPFFLIDRRYAVSGAQPAELLLRALEQTWGEREQGGSAEGDSGGGEGYR